MASAWKAASTWRPIFTSWNWYRLLKVLIQLTGTPSEPTVSQTPMQATGGLARASAFAACACAARAQPGSCVPVGRPQHSVL